MDMVTELFFTVLQLAFFGLLILSITKIARSKKQNGAKAEIQAYQARISKLRLALRGKIKRKSNVFRSRFKSLTEGDSIDTALRGITDINFETGEEFQNYFDLCKKIVGALLIEVNKDAATPISFENDFMCSDFKLELDIIRLTKELTLLCPRLNEKIDIYNRGNSSQPIPRLDNLSFQAMSEVNRIFKDEALPDADLSKANEPIKPAAA